MKFTDHGSVELRARVVTEGDAAEVFVAVTDSGRGIPAEALPHIFDRFYQADSSLTRSTEGTGLGLAISQNLARMMGGRIEVESEPGIGSTFTFATTLPGGRYARGRSGMRPEPGLVPGVPAEAAGQILVVEDNAVNALILRAMLRKLGHEPLMASDGFEGIAMADRLRPRLVLMDLQMPRSTASRRRGRSDRSKAAGRLCSSR